MLAACRKRMEATTLLCALYAKSLEFPVNMHILETMALKLFSPPWRRLPEDIHCYIMSLLWGTLEELADNFASCCTFSGIQLTRTFLKTCVPLGLHRISREIASHIHQLVPPIPFMLFVDAGLSQSDDGLCSDGGGFGTLLALVDDMDSKLTLTLSIAHALMNKPLSLFRHETMVIKIHQVRQCSRCTACPYDRYDTMSIHMNSKRYPIWFIDREHSTLCLGPCTQSEESDTCTGRHTAQMLSGSLHTGQSSVVLPLQKSA